MNKFIEVNQLKEVTNPVFYEFQGIPTTDGLFSYEIFGRLGSDERKENFAYINLKKKFLHPKVYDTLIRLNRKFADLIYAKKYFIIKNHTIEESEEGIDGAGTSIDFLYKNWEKLDFKTTGSVIREERIDFIKYLKKDEIFMDKFLVIPAFYRDVNFSSFGQGKLSHDVLSDKYSRLIRLCKSLTVNENSSFNFMSFITINSIQQLLFDIYTYLSDKVRGKDGIFRQVKMGKNIDFAGRTVISAPKFNQNHYKDCPTNSTHSGVPIVQVINLFYPFILKWINDYTKNILEYVTTVSNIEISSNSMDQFLNENLSRQVNLYTKSPEERFNFIYLKDKNNRNLGISMKSIKAHLVNEKDDIKGASPTFDRYMTWTDLFFLAAYNVVKDKHVYLTRYPLTDYFGIYPSKINVLSTVKTISAVINGEVIKQYPLIDINYPREKIKNLFVDTLNISNIMCPALGADYDGRGLLL